MAKPVRLISHKAPPCGPASVEVAWERLEKWFRAHYPEVMENLTPGASASAIRAFETAIGQTLPEEVRQSYLIHDGLDRGFFSGAFYSLKEALREWRRLQTEPPAPARPRRRLRLT